MRMKTLGRGGPEVSEICLGSMTWGTQNTLEEGHEQISMALDHGVNFIDTAEMYPTNPISAETIGRTERIIGLWLEDTGRRDDVVLATKHSGEGMAHVRDGARISAATIPETIEGSLRRLKTDYIDIYQFHWPNRGSYHFRRNWRYDPSGQDPERERDHMREALRVLQDHVKAGKIRHFGLSNETAWGMAQWLAIAEETGGPRPVSIQNEYSLLCRLFDTDLAELCLNEDVGLMAYTPLAAGLLTGKYQSGKIPVGSRMERNADLGGRKTDRAFIAVQAYLDLARSHGLDLSQMALAWALRRPFMGSVIIGATSTAQLGKAIDAAALELSGEVLDEIEALHRQHPMPF